MSFRRQTPIAHPDELERIKEQREKYRLRSLARPETVPIIALNHVERDAARDVYQTMEACAKSAEEKRTGVWPVGGLNSAQVVDEIIRAINLSRVKQAQINAVSLNDDGTGILG